MNFIHYILKYFKNRDIQRKKKSDIPWIEIESVNIDDDGNLIFSLDWNDAFITKIKHEGFTGIRDDELIDKYLYALYAEAVDNYELSGFTNLGR